MDTTIIDDLRRKFRQGSMLMQLIYINCAVFVIIAVIQISLMLFRLDASPFLRFLQLPASLGNFLKQPWSILTYMFLHAGLLHLVFNMLWLYWFGTMFLQYFSAKHLRGLYLFGGFCGGALYMLMFNIFPVFTPIVNYAFMMGASASVLAVVAAVAYREPNYPVNLLLLGTFKLKYLALVVIGLDLLFINSENAGGHIAHLGGALSGLWFAYSLAKGSDLTKWINNAIDLLTSIFTPKYRKPRMKVEYGSKRQADYDFNTKKKEKNDQIDTILEKIKKSGYSSLTEEEKKALFNASKH